MNYIGNMKAKKDAYNMGAFEPVVTSVSSSVVVVGGGEELSSDFAQPMITKLMIPRKTSKLVNFFIRTSLNNKS